MSFALPARQVNFGRPQLTPQQQQQYLQQQQQQQLAYAAQQLQQNQPQSKGLALPSAPATTANAYVPPSTNLSLPGPSTQPATQSPPPTATQPTNAVAGPSTPAASAVPATPAPLTLEQQHITAVEGIVPTLQNIVATVNLDCRLDLKTIALHARNAEYNPKVCNAHYR